MNFIEDGNRVLANLADYYHQSVGGKKKVIRQVPIREIHEELNLAGHLKEGDLTGETLEAFLNTYLDNTTRLHHPGCLAHQVGCSHPTGALGSLIDGFTNNAMAIYEMGPAAAAIEFFMINHLLCKIGWRPMPEKIRERLTFPHGGGVLTHGGSLANITALLTARNHLDSRIREQGARGDVVILASDAAHYSVSKAAGIIGIGEHNVIPLETDTAGRIDISKLETAVQTTAENGGRIAALVANACSTGTGIYDPVGDIADFCRENGIWLHADCAHGGGALFSDKYRPLLAGLEKADSIIIDAHKMLRTPTVCASLLVKNAAALDHAFAHRASYIFHEKDQPGFDFIGQSVECTKAGLGLKFYMALAAMGEKGIASYIDKTYDLAREAGDYIAAQPDFEVAIKPESNILCFRYTQTPADQLAIRNRLIREGAFYISAASLNARQYLRMVIMNPETDMADIRGLISAVRQAASGGSA